jgi:HlyD family secretion protein
LGLIPSWLLRRRRLAIALALAAIGGTYLALSSEASEYEYVSAAPEVGDVVQVVSAGGKLRAPNMVNVGTEASGQINRVLVDFNSPVKAGQLLAVIDGTRFEAQVRRNRAEIAQARAQLALAHAALSRADADVSARQRNFDRRQTLTSNGFLSPSALDEARNQLASSKASREEALAQIASAKAQVLQSEASLAAAERELSLTQIVSPIDGTVVNKLVEEGQTVASSFQTPNLFVIAGDTTRMQIEALIDEADVGRIAAGQEARFFVDSYPSHSFKALVKDVRRTPVEAQNVVSYMAILAVPDSDARLLPGMTTNVEILVARKRAVRRIPAAALRFTPAGAAKDAARTPANVVNDVRSGGRQGTVWVLDAGGKHPVRRLVRLGLEAEDYIEVEGGLAVQDRVITRANVVGNSDSSEHESEH